MAELFERRADEPEIHPARKLLGSVSAVLQAPGQDFVTQKVDGLTLDFRGVVGDVHYGETRRSGGREPWYPRGTEMRNERQLSIVATDELAAIAKSMGIARIAPEWIGANLVLDGVPRLSMLPSGTMLFFKGGVTLKVDGQNVPCRLAGRSVAEHAGMPDIQAGELAFPKFGRRLRGLVAWIEKPGVIETGEAVSVRVPEQWVYR
ncbi:molybdenum cofactor sulfurase [Mesorhizobium sp. YIM 152430]|uniref:MOSC domain-containing protein n=1 Tax=Mesorhizobium sp. YIM 152430 TaxID=3031761 RepID=UPI0023DC790B|nr:MOSC domain-containing protein [Mesorhizobium sp. YIM 152430]MDF1598386.1 molybdenum cofactor sulfurase [Mesorhizobium sp. YIM 152430]